uniref:Nitrogen permease regulator 3 n=1 Tax=Odontella aurita TaxID=265563 RepID=A0A7S4K842_9STRA
MTSEGPSPVSSGGGGGSPSPFRVLGVALVVEEPGRGARLVFRYPSSPPPPPPPPPASTIPVSAAPPPAAAADRAASSAPHPSPASPTSHRHHHPSCELFFTLSPRAMAKLFRPKPPLCGQPMTLSVGGTVFCCHAVLLPGGGGAGGGGLGSSSHGNDTADSDTASGGGIGGGDEDATGAGPTSSQQQQQTKDLVLFSVIVALAPLQEFSKTFRFDGGDGAAANMPHSHLLGRHSNHEHRPNPASSGGNNAAGTSSSPRVVRRRGSTASASSAAAATGGGRGGVDGSAARGGSQALSASLMAIRGVHLSLRRLCRVLEREERRCRYVSLQASIMVRIKNEVEKGADGNGRLHKPQHKRTSSAVSSAPSASHSGDRSSSGEGRGSDVGLGNVHGSHAAVDDAEAEQKRRDREMRQAVLELMFASSTLPGDIDDDGLVRGNLARELAQLFHALSRNSSVAAFTPTPAALLGGGGGLASGGADIGCGVLYVNSHVAVPIEPAAGRLLPLHVRANGYGTSAGSPAIDYLRPYHTLLFPHASPAELLRTQALSSSSVRAGPSGDAQGQQQQRHGQRLERLLLMISPGKSLRDAAVDAALPVPAALQLASRLVDAGACVASHVVGRHTCFVMNHGGAARMGELALPFAQRFLGPAVPVFLAASALTVGGTKSTSPGASGVEGASGGSVSGNIVTLGRCMRVAAGRGTAGDDDGALTAAQLLGDRIAAALYGSIGVAGAGGASSGGGGGSGSGGSVFLHPRTRPRGSSVGEEGGSHQHRLPPLTSSPRAAEMRSSGGGSAGLGPGSTVGVAAPGQSVEDVVYEMALWLRSHGIIVELREYLTAVDPIGGDANGALRVESGVDGTTSVAPAPVQAPFAPSSNTAAPSPVEQIALSPTWSHIPDGGVAASATVVREEAIYHELLEAGCLLGTVSTTALCWRFGLDHWRIQRLREWGVKARKLQVITRIPASGDDWDVP